MTISQTEAEKCVDGIHNNAEAYAKAKSERVHIEQFLKSKLALLMKDFPGDSVASREIQARAHPEYIQLLDALKIAVETEERIKWKLTAAELRVDLWRTQAANERRG